MTIEHKSGHGLISYLDPIVKTTLAQRHCRVSTLDDFDDERKAAIVKQLMKEALENITRDNSNLVINNSDYADNLFFFSRYEELLS